MFLTLILAIPKKHYSKAAINLFYQRLWTAEKFTKVVDVDDTEKWRPSFKGQDGILMKYHEIHLSQLLEVPLSFADLKFILERSRPTINLWQINQMRQFERKHSNPTILDVLDEEKCKEEETATQWYHLFTNCMECISPISDL